MVSLASSFVSPSPSPATIRILIADDHPLFRDGLRRLLQAEPGFEVVGEASDGDVLVDLARKTKPDIILLDLNMPRMDGFELLQRMRAEKLLDRVAVVMCYTSPYEQDITRAKDLGACGYLTKPPDFGKLKQILEMSSTLEIVRDAGNAHVLLRAAQPSGRRVSASP